MNTEPIKSLQCATCGNIPINMDAKYCLRDGSKLVAKTARCACGNYIDLRFAKFCENCGTGVSKAVQKEVEV